MAIPGKRERALLAYLALSPKGRQPRRKLAALLWGDATDQTLLDNLRTCVWRLRKVLGDTEHRLLASDDEDIVLDIAAFDVDALAFRRQAAQSGRTALEAAAGLCNGEFLDGLELDSEEFESWRRGERSRQLDLAVDLLSRLMMLLMEGGQSERAIAMGARVLKLDPLHEATARHMMRLYADSGRRGAAIQLYRALAEALLRDVNTQPEAETKLVYTAIAQANGADPTSVVQVENYGDAAAPTIGARDDPLSAPRTRRTWRRPLAGLFAAGFAVIALGFYWQAHWVQGMAGTSAMRASVSAAPLVSPVQAAPATIAVLPFDNLSGDPAQQFFSDGMTEEISAALAKVPGLRLTARTSAFRFRGNNDARQVGAQLGVQYVIEGAVRKEENRVRITAQLVRTGTGLSVWSDSYDRELTDVFAIQEEIATAIAHALRLSLGKAGENLVASRNIDPQSYEQFLRAMPLVRARQTGVAQAVQILEPLVARNPKFAPAWALLAYCYGLMPALAPPHSVFPYAAGWDEQTRQRIREFWPKAEAAAHRAIQLDPKLATAYFALGVLEHFRGKLTAADDLFLQSLNLDPYNPDALAWRMSLLADVGKQKEALALARQLMALDPYVPSWKQDAAEIFWVNGHHQTAVEMLQSLLDRPSGPTSLAMVYASEGRYKEAAEAMETSLKVRGEYIPGQSLPWRTTAQLLRAAPAHAVLPPDSLRLGRSSFVYLYVGAPERSLEFYEDDVRAGLIGGHGNSFSYLWHPSHSPARKTERFKSLMRNAGMLDYWRQRGWPDYCRPAGADDFVCH
ncbi:MAG TPA: BTAD domain-containing putative transcriptional regulator [Rhizomicrobium sp.]|nr:BTAD domain-containing putative transcriptional regulator [Rhizomicrobium sp.]